MKDPRSLYAAVLAGLSIAAAVILVALGDVSLSSKAFGLAGALAAYAIGLHSDLRDGK